MLIKQTKSNKKNLKYKNKSIDNGNRKNNYINSVYNNCEISIKVT